MKTFQEVIHVLRYWLRKTADIKMPTVIFEFDEPRDFECIRSQVAAELRPLMFSPTVGEQLMGDGKFEMMGAKIQLRCIKKLWTTELSYRLEDFRTMMEKWQRRGGYGLDEYIEVMRLLVEQHDAKRTA